MRQPFKKASIYIAMLLVFEAVLGALIIMFTGIYQTMLTSYLADSEGLILKSYLFNIYVYGSQLIVTFLCSICMWRRLWVRRFTPNVSLLISFWILFSYVIVIAGFASVLNFYNSSEVLANAAETSLLNGIDLYYSCPEWKLLWDAMQIQKGCCGVHSFKDWMNAEWMPQSDCFTNLSNSVIAPYACCKKDYDCFDSSDEQFRQEKARRPYPTITLDHINTNGCLPIFSDTVRNFMYILLGLSLMAVKLLILLSCLTKYIVSRQNVGDGFDNAGFSAEDGYPLIVVKYPCNVRCLAIADDDLVADLVSDDIPYCKCGKPIDEPAENGYCGE